MSHIAFPPSDTVVDDVVADFATTAREWSDYPAILHDGVVISYGELADRIDRTQSRYRAARSTSRGTPDLVGVLVSHTPEMVEHLLGILYAGAAYCPIDAAVPAARKETLAAVLGLDRVFDATGGAYGPTSLHVDALPEATDDSQILSAETDPAYVLCTSGSTGAPKPVVISRRALTATVRALRELFALTHEDRVLQFASLGWDTCLEEILPALTAGASLVFDEQAQSGSFPRFVRMLTERSITVLDLPTAFWHELVLFLHEEQVALPDSVRLVIIGGERIDPTRLQQWRELGTAHVGLLNTYGCTETTMITHAVHLAGPDGDPAVAADAVEVPLGRPLPHVTDHVTDEGELLVAGPGLATEYLGLPDRTATGFPIEDHGGGPTRWFRTGDLVTRGERGLLYPRGRADEQVKVLGVRVHPAEVEMQLSTHPAVAAAVVVGERRLGQMSLRAFVVASSETTAADLKRHLRERLPSQFVPGRITFVAALAHTASGKVDRAATQRAAMDSDTKGEAS